MKLWYYIGHSWYRPTQGVWKSRAWRASLGERNVKKKKKYFFFTFRHSCNTCINVTNFYLGSNFLLRILVISSQKSTQIMICMYSGEQKHQNGPENQMISKLCLENVNFFQTTWAYNAVSSWWLQISWCPTYRGSLYVFVPVRLPPPAADICSCHNFCTLWTKWPPFHRRYFKLHICEGKVLYFD